MTDTIDAEEFWAGGKLIKSPKKASRWEPQDRGPWYETITHPAVDAANRPITVTMQRYGIKPKQGGTGRYMREFGRLNTLVRTYVEDGIEYEYAADGEYSDPILGVECQTQAQYDQALARNQRRDARRRADGNLPPDPGV